LLQKSEEREEKLMRVIEKKDRELSNFSERYIHSLESQVNTKEQTISSYVDQLTQIQMVML